MSIGQLCGERGLVYGKLYPDVNQATRVYAVMRSLWDDVFRDRTDVGVPQPFNATRYHSLAVVDSTVPRELTVTARTQGGVIMGLQHDSAPVYGVQFHPESVLTEGGFELLANWLTVAGLFLVSFLILFFELAAIRWFGATVVFLTFFTNVVLLACFLGMSVGLLATGRAQRLVRSTLPLGWIGSRLPAIASSASISRRNVAATAGSISAG